MNWAKTSLNERLGIEMTHLANERSFLAYVRTFMVFLSSGVAIMKIEILSDLKWLAYALLLISPFILMIGIYRFFRVRTMIRAMVEEHCAQE